MTRADLVTVRVYLAPDQNVTIMDDAYRTFFEGISLFLFFSFSVSFSFSFFPFSFSFSFLLVINYSWNVYFRCRTTHQSSGTQ